jgi:HEAT repeat protein
MSQPDIAALRADCRSGDTDKQLSALLELIKIHDEPSLPDIVPLLSSSDEQVRAEAARAVGYLGSLQTAALAPQLQTLLSDANEMVRDEAVEALGLLIYPPAIATLKGILHHDPSWLVRASAAEALGNYQDVTILSDLEQVLRDPQEESAVKVYAARSLGHFATSTYFPTLDTLIATHRQEPGVAAALLATGYRLGGLQYLDPLLALLRNANETESWFLLNEVQDLVEDRKLSTLAADSPRIHAALQTTVLRWPLTSRQVQEIENKLPQA